MAATAEHDDAGFEFGLKTVIVYDDFDLATKANTVLSRAAQRADPHFRWNVTLWPTHMLGDSLANAVALSKAVEADLVFLAIRRLTDELPRLLDWLERWAKGRRVHDAVLAIYNDRDNGAVFAPGALELARFAQRYGLSFNFGGAGAGAAPPQTAAHNRFERAREQP